MASESKSAARARRGIFLVLAEAGITSRDDRLELAEDILGKRIDSFSNLDDDDYIDLHFGLLSWRRVQDVRSANRSIIKEAILLVEGTYDIDLSQYDKIPSQSLPHQG